MFLLALVIVFASLWFAGVVYAASNISRQSAEHWAWNDAIGWIQFNTTASYPEMTVNVISAQLQGYASSSAGEISLDCTTTSAGDICGQSSYKVINDGMGNLSGWGWNDNYGWISFCGGQSSGNCPGTIAYRVLIDPNNGDFSNYAWNDVLGWISFNCADPGVCVGSSYKVKTSWLATSTSGYVDSSTYDTGVTGGAQINSIIWRGNQPAGTSVKFQLAGSNSSSGPWSFSGPDGTVNTYYSAGSGTPIPTDYVLYNNKRYFRYRMTLVSNQAQTASPQVDEVIVNWSP